MKAIVYKEYGPPDVLHLQDVPPPTTKEDEVLIRVHAASINSWDWDLLRGDVINRVIFRGWRRPKLTILGCDVAGRVEAVGGAVTRFRPGDAVFADISGSGWGGFAEYVCAREDVVAPKSAAMTFEEAAAVPQAGVLALQGLRHKREPEAGQKVLINGAGGGVGTFAIQMAKSLGAEVTGVDNAGKLDLMRSLGADHVIDYTREDFTKNDQQYDVILDVVAHHSMFDYRRALGPTGIYVMVGGGTAQIFQLLFVGPWASMTGGKKMGLLMHKPNPEDLALLNGLFEADTVRPIIDGVYPLSETPEAFRHFGSEQARGKVVITLGDYL